MPSLRPRRKPQPPREPGQKRNAIVAAVSKLRRNPNGFAKIYRADWQTEGWRQYDLNGALAYAANWLARSMSRCQITVVEVDERGNILGPTDNAQVLEIASGLVESPARMSEMLWDIGIQLFVPGDMYVITEPGADDVFSRWIVASTEEVTIQTDYVMYNPGDPGLVEKFTLDNSIVFRVHNPHPRKHFEATSPSRAAIPTLRKIEELDKYLFSTVSSRISSQGILGIPSEMDLPVAPEDVQPGETPFMAALAEAILEENTDLGSVSSAVPIVIEGPAEAISAINWIVNPNGELPSTLAELRNNAVHQLSVDLDVPAEVILGSSEANRYNVWQIEEQAIKLHVEPKMITVVHAFTEGFLRPALQAHGIDDTKYAFWFSSADLVLRPDRSADATTAHDRGVISDEAYLKYIGLEDGDAPTGDELKAKQLLRLIALSPTAADALLPVILRLYGLDDEATKLEESAAPPVDPGGTPADPSQPPADPNRANPQRPVEQPKPTVANPSPK